MKARRIDKGGIIDRSTPLKFTWDGKTLEGYQGDSLASALLANNQAIIARSFKYHRPRGIMSCGVEESGALVTLGEDAYRDPNVRATTQALYDGLVATGQNAWPSVRFDVGAINNLLGTFFAAGFYYKTFMGLPPFEWGSGTRLWMQYEKIIRKAAGMGRASRSPDPDTYEHGHLFCDLLIIGAGPAGLSAAIEATERGLDVLLVEQDEELGGDLLGQSHGHAERNKLVTQLEQTDAKVMRRTTAFGLYDNGTAGLLERVSDHLSYKPTHEPRQRFWTVRAQQTILATGAIERHIAFDNNDRPGIMTAAAGRHYLNRYGVLAGQRIMIATNNDSAYASAIDLAGSGAAVTLLDARQHIDKAMRQALHKHNIDLRLATAPLSAKGRRSIKAVQLATGSTGNWQRSDSPACDLLLVSSGWSPVVNLISHRGVRPTWQNDLACFTVPEPFEGIRTIGSAAGLWRTSSCQESALRAINDVTKSMVGSRVSITTTRINNQPASTDWQTPILPLYEVKVKGLKSKAFVDFQHDVTCADVRLAHQEGYQSVEHLKRYTTLGMATDGGKMGNIIGLALMAEALGKEIPAVGTTVFRPPYAPIAIGALSGRAVAEHFKPLRRTPLHNWNIEHGAVMTMAGLWHRPWYFPRKLAMSGGSSVQHAEGSSVQHAEGSSVTSAEGSVEKIDAAYIREAITARKSVGLCDVTSLGKIAIQGPDATQLLNRIYTNPFAKLPIGKARYGVMLRDDGIVMDDGTTWRLSESDYFMTTTTAQAAKVLAFLEELLQTRWQDLRVHVTSVSEQWAGCAVAGPRSRELLTACIKEANSMDDQAFPFMGVRELTLKNDIRCRIARISFSGELAYEVYVPSDYGPDMMDLLYAHAQTLDGCLYGLEALGTMRIEKGHVTAAELDGRVTLEDAGLGKMASPKKAYIGSALRQRPELQRADRAQLVGFFPTNKSHTFNSGSIVCKPDHIEGLGEGWVSSVTHSPELGHWIGLGFIKGGLDAWRGKTAIVADPLRNKQIEIEIVSPNMIDPSGDRMHG